MHNPASDLVAKHVRGGRRYGGDRDEWQHHGCSRAFRMTATAWVLLLAVLVLDTGSHLLLKRASMRAKAAEGERAFILSLLGQPTLWIAIPAFVALFFAWIGFISHVPLSQGVMAGSITIAGVMLGGRLFFAEQITGSRALAIASIAAGVVLVGWGT